MPIAILVGEGEGSRYEFDYLFGHTFVINVNYFKFCHPSSIGVLHVVGIISWMNIRPMFRSVNRCFSFRKMDFLKLFLLYFFSSHCLTSIKISLTIFLIFINCLHSWKKLEKPSNLPFFHNRPFDYRHKSEHLH